MFNFVKCEKEKFLFSTVSQLIVFVLSFLLIFSPTANYAQSVLNLPAPGAMVTASSAYVPPMLKGIIIDPENPFQFDFILDSGDSELVGEDLKEESSKLIRYFLTSLTMPEDDLWVNLSPYEKDRIIPDLFGQTEMGRDLLAQDYLLKQLTSSLMYPENELGEEFWNKIYDRAQEEYGTTEIPINTFNKVWIVPEKAVVYENGDRAFVVESHLKVMLEEDYLAMSKSKVNQGNEDLSVAKDIMKEIILPEIEKEINEGENFAQLRQIYSSFILASWYKKNLKNNLLNRKYANQKKIAGIETEDRDVKLKIYNHFLEAFREGVYDYIREEYNPNKQEFVPRRYFSGGFDLSSSEIVETPDDALLNEVNASSTFRISGNYLTSENKKLSVTSSPIKDKKQSSEKNSKNEDVGDFQQEPPALSNQYDDDRVLKSYLKRVLPGDVLHEIEGELHRMGALAAGTLYEQQQADRLNEPVLTQWDPWGKRIDDIELTSLWKEAERLAVEYGLIATAYERKHEEFSRIHQFALVHLFTPSTDLYCCPLSMTDGAAKVLLTSGNKSLIDKAFPHLTSRSPKNFWTSGQWMTELTGGSDVGLSETIARPNDDGTWQLYGRKWFTSAATSQMALALARPENNPLGSKGLALFYVELRDKDNRLRNIEIDRLKDKLGTRKVPTAELTLDGTPAELVGELTNGVRAIAPILTITRTWNAVQAIAMMRRGLALARDYARKREAFGALLSQKPLHADTLAGLQAAYEGAFHLTFRTIELLGQSESNNFSADPKGTNNPLLRVLTPLTKLVTARQAVTALSDVIESFGGAGYVEDTGLPMLLRDTQVLPIWEGTTNVLALDMIRALNDVSAGNLDVLKSEFRNSAKTVSDPRLLEALAQAENILEAASTWLNQARMSGPAAVEAGARRFALQVGLAMEIALLARHAQWSLENDLDARAVVATQRLAAGSTTLEMPKLSDSFALANDTPLPVNGVVVPVNEIVERKRNKPSSSPVREENSSSSPIKKQNTGGIDFHPDNFDIQTQGNGLNVSFPLDIEAMENIEINGLVPFIFSITPVSNLPLLMGAIKEEEEGLELSLLEK